MVEYNRPQRLLSMGKSLTNVCILYSMRLYKSVGSQEKLREVGDSKHWAEHFLHAIDRALSIWPPKSAFPDCALIYWVKHSSLKSFVSDSYVSLADFVGAISLHLRKVKRACSECEN